MVAYSSPEREAHDITEDQLDSLAISSIASVRWLDQAMRIEGGAPNIAMLLHAMFQDETKTRIVTQRVMEFMNNPSEMEQRRHELFGTDDVH